MPHVSCTRTNDEIEVKIEPTYFYQPEEQIPVRILPKKMPARIAEDFSGQGSFRRSWKHALRQKFDSKKMYPWHVLLDSEIA